MNTEIEQFGIHFMLDGYGAPKQLLKDKEKLTNLLEEIPPSMGMHNISEPMVVEVGPKNRKDPGGISGVVLIAESHLSFHTFPERRFITIDVYTCQNSLDIERLTKIFVESFKLETFDTYVQKRGVRYPAENIPD